MSSKPSPAGVEQLIDRLDFMASLERELAELRPKVERLKVVEEQYLMVQQDITKQLRAMDCESTGNYGWVDRLVWMLREMVQQVRRARE